MLEEAPDDLDLIEAHAGDVGDAAVSFVFGTLHPTPAHVALPTIERIFASTYEPYDPVTGKLLLRTTWERTSPLSVARETRYMRSMIAGGFDPLVRDTSGWVRSVSA